MKKKIIKEPLDDFRVTALKFNEINEDRILAWESLEERAMVANAYLSPSFVLPVLRNLVKPKSLRKIIFIFIEKKCTEENNLVGLGIFRTSNGNWHFPAPHLIAFKFKHSYLGGLLIDKTGAEETIEVLIRFFIKNRKTWHAVAFNNFPVEENQAELIVKPNKRFDVSWHESYRCRRPILAPNEGGEEYLRKELSSHYNREIRRWQKKIQKEGQVSWRIHSGDKISKNTIDRFLELEHMGWKGENKSSLISNDQDKRFYIEMAESFQKRNKIYFTEIILDQKIIASMCYLVYGSDGFAFKLGWHADYAKSYPGILNIVEGIRQAPVNWGGIRLIDSGSTDGTFIGRLWTGRRTLSNGMLGISWLGKNLLCLDGRLRRIKRYCNRIKTQNGDETCKAEF